MAEVRWRHATAQDVAAFFDGAIPCTLRAVVVEVDGAPGAMVGVADGIGVRCFFSEEKPDFAPHRCRMATLRAIQRVSQWVRDSVVPVISVSDNDTLMERLGFKQLEPGIYTYDRTR